MKTRTLKLWAAIGLALVAAAAALLGVTAPLVRAPLGLLLALALPGFALTCAVLPRAELGPARLAALSAGLSLALAALAGPLLLAAGIPLTAASLTLAAAGITVGAAGVALVRGSLAGGSLRGSLGAALPPMQGLYLAMAVGVAIAALSMAATGKERYGGEQFTELWALPAASGEVNIGVRSRETEAANFALTLTLDGEAVEVYDTIELEPGALWETSWEHESLAAPGRLEVLLYREDSERAPYRQVALWLEQ